MSICFWYSNQKLRRKRDSRAQTPLCATIGMATRHSGRRCGGAGWRRDAEHQHAVGATKGDLVVTGAVAEREVTGTGAPRAVLAVDAFAFHLQVQEEQRAARARHVRARVPHDLRVGVDLGERQVADRGARDAAVESADVYRIGYQRRESLAGAVVPVRELATRIQTIVEKIPQLP
jgi:hypothetical protein